MGRTKTTTRGNIVAKNRKARRDYVIHDKFEAGIVLKGTEVKSLREGRASIGEAFAGEKGSELFLQNAYIPEYSASGAASYEPRAPRKLLMHRGEIGKLLSAINRKGMTIVPLSVYFNKRGIAKVELAIAEGKQQRDKRQTVKQRDWDRQKARLLRNKD